MRTIINKVIYDTNTSIEVAEFSSSYSRRDHNYYEETLYKTVKGNWFLAGTGGPATKYAVACGNMSSGGSGIIPLDEEEVINWLEKNDEVELLEEHFPHALIEA